MREKVVELLRPVPEGLYVDCTLGGGGHTRAILEKAGPGGFLVGIDQDPAAISNARTSLKEFGPKLVVFHNNFSELLSVIRRTGVGPVNGLVADLGVSLFQFSQSGRGFSFQKNELLDMRMDPTSGAMAARDVINTFSEGALADIFFTYGEERMSRRIAKRIVRERGTEPILTSSRLANVVAAAKAGKPGPRKRIHPATKTFMALRIFVNSELDHLKQLMDDFVECLKPGGRAVVISFHSLEDRIIKNRFRELAKGCTCPPKLPVCVCGKTPMGRVLSGKGLTPEPLEIKNNPMARSARLRAFERN